ncbi:ATP-dependent RNA helicase DEAH12, chloroplastic [Capsella rubella]|uniref:ATP-dependent RNA helicase DEAH12, chloroplastic n=1 Tax=Capsella rubella TaxID=81985 RepID=UPI000CD56169|nr:ATP-dependent RNA helicase DEAH12, chloroplastic [Capsella rubella]
MERDDINLISKEGCIDSTTTEDTPNSKSTIVYRLYFKGFVIRSNETTAVVNAGFGVAMCDNMDELVFKIKKTLSNNAEISRKGVEITALIHGLNESLGLGFKNVVIYCDDHRIYQYLSGKEKPKKKLVHLVEEVQRLREKLTSSEVDFVARNDVKFAYRLAREELDSQSLSNSVNAETSSQRETCVICLEERDAERMFCTEGCSHRHCFSCVKQYVEVKLLNGKFPTCLAYGCMFELTLESCIKVLTPNLIELWKQRTKEDSIPATERIYCPYPNCSVLMSLTELSRSADDETSYQSSVRECVKCRGLFCIDCKVPSHSNLSCDDYKKLHGDQNLVDVLKLNSLASYNMWRQCVKCRHLIELSHGCNHMTCRCGYEFCYNCGTQWYENDKTEIILKLALLRTLSKLFSVVVAVGDLLAVF